jgi:septal ring factor EnvC (AmiA/AmiB activator)
MRALGGVFSRSRSLALVAISCVAPRNCLFFFTCCCCVCSHHRLFLHFVSPSKAKIDQRYRKVKREWEHLRQEESRRASREEKDFLEREREWEHREHRKIKERRRDREREQEELEERQYDAASDLEHSPKVGDFLRRLLLMSTCRCTASAVLSSHQRILSP